MHTVIILNKYSSDLMKDYKFLFKSFIDEGIISFCDWNEFGTDVKTSVPDLYRIIKGKQEWRAIVIDTASMRENPIGPIPNERNPFDFPVEIFENDIPKESEIPLVRLSHIICGYPTAAVKSFEKGFEFYDDEKNELVRLRESELTEEGVYELSNKYGDLLKDIYMEVEVAEEVKQAREALINKYSFSDIRPRELIFISTRKHLSDEEHIYESWKTQLEIESSNFCSRNRYPNNCRFLCYSITNSENSRYVRELMEFWLSILTLSINTISASTLQAYKLYRLGVEVSEKEFGRLLNQHLNQMETAYGYIQECLSVQPEYSFGIDEEIVPKQNIPVIFEGISGTKLYVDTGYVGLSRDCPEDELQLWRNDMLENKRKVAQYMKVPRRALDKAAQYLRSRTESFYGNEYELDKFQIEDLLEEIDRLEQEVLSCDTRSVVDYQKIKAEMQDIDNKVKKNMANRMRKNIVIATGLVALFVYLLGYVPYLLNAYRLGAKQFGASLILVLIAVAIVAIGGLVSLFIIRHRLVKSMKQFNELVRKLINNVNSSADKFEEYFSLVCGYMKAQAIYKGIRVKDRTFSPRHILKVHRRALSASIKRNEELLASYGIMRRPEPEMNVATIFDENKYPKDNRLYYFEKCETNNEIKINDTGDLVRTPYRFVEKLLVEREDIFDDTKGEK